MERGLRGFDGFSQIKQEKIRENQPDSRHPCSIFEPQDVSVR